MTFIDPIGDMITRIRNGQLRLLDNVKIPSSKLRVKILEVLKKEGYISNYKIEDLRKLACECNISLNDGPKKKVKKILYDEINLYQLNHYVNDETNTS